MKIHFLFDYLDKTDKQAVVKEELRSYDLKATIPQFIQYDH